MWKRREGKRKKGMGNAREWKGWEGNVWEGKRREGKWNAGEGKGWEGKGRESELSIYVLITTLFLLFPGCKVDA